MYTAKDIAARLASPVHALMSTTDRLGYVYMSAGLVVALLIYAWHRYVKHRTTRPVLSWIFAPEIWLHRSAKVDYIYFITNRLLRVFTYGWFLISAEVLFKGTSWLLEAIWGPSIGAVEPSWVWAVAATLVAVLSKDFMMWCAHTLFHVVPELWEFHKVHHSAEVMTPFTSARMHPVDEIITASIVGAGVGVAWTIFQFFVGPDAHEITLMQANIVTTVFLFAAFQLRHSHIWLAYPNWLQHIVISPAQHQIHHSVAREHWDKNQGYIFALWDWAFGTLVSPTEYIKLTYGLGTDETPEFQSVQALYFRPFANVWRRLRRRVQPSEAGSETVSYDP